MGLLFGALLALAGVILLWGFSDYDETGWILFLVGIGTAIVSTSIEALLRARAHGGKPERR